jgi:putative transposase
LICAFIDAHKDRYGVAPICRALAVHGVTIAPRTYWAHRSAAPSKRALWDTTITEILAGYYENPTPRANARQNRCTAA